MTTTFKQFKTKALKNPAVKAEYEALGPEYAVVKTIIAERIKRGWSQTELAEAIGSQLFLALNAVKATLPCKPSTR